MNINISKITAKLNLFYWIPYYIFSPFVLLAEKNNFLRTTFIPTFGLFHRLFAKDKVNIFFAFLYPVIFLAVLGLAMSPAHLVAGMGAMVPSTICLILLPQQLVELRQSSLMKKIGSTKVKPWILNTTIFFYYSFIVLIAAFTAIGIGMVMWSDKVQNEFGIHYSRINWGGITLGIFYGILIFLPLGLFISSIASNPRMAQLIGLIITVPLAFLSGQFLPLTLIHSSETMKWISFFLPQRFPTQLISESFIGPSAATIDSDSVLAKLSSGASITPSDLQPHLLPETYSPLDLDQTYRVIDHEGGWLSLRPGSEIETKLNLIKSKNLDYIKGFVTALDLKKSGIPIATPTLKKLAMGIPFAWSIVFWALALKTFKWGRR